MPTDGPFPDWEKPATKGDVVTAAIYSRAVTGALASAVIALRGGNSDQAYQALMEYFKAADELGSLIQKIGGEKLDGQ